MEMTTAEIKENIKRLEYTLSKTPIFDKGYRNNLLANIQSYKNQLNGNN